MPAAGMSFVKLEGNYVISFRDMNEALPAFTAVKLDRRRGSWDGSAVDSASSLAVGAGPRRGSFSVGMSSSGGAGSPLGGSLAGSRVALGEELTAAAAAASRRRSSLAVTPFKLVLTGVPRGVREDLIRSRLETVIDGIGRVYRDPDMARNLSHPPVFVETMSALAQDAFMLRGDWVPVVQRLCKEANAPEASADEGLGASFDVASTGAADDDVFSEEQRRRQSLVDTLVTCPHGRYHGQATCPLCRAAGGRRNTMVVDDVLTHADAPASPRPPARLAAAAAGFSADAAAPAAPKKSSSSCSSCVACLRRFIPGMRRKAKVVLETPVPEQQQQQPARRAPEQGGAQHVSFLDPGMLSAIKSQRRLSAYDDVAKQDDVPAIKVDHHL